MLVAELAAFTAKDLPGAPLLAVEVLSPSTQLFDRNLKKAAYERIGAAHFWLVDPRVPSCTPTPSTPTATTDWSRTSAATRCS